MSVWPSVRVGSTGEGWTSALPIDEVGAGVSTAASGSEIEAGSEDGVGAVIRRSPANSMFSMTWAMICSPPLGFMVLEPEVEDWASFEADWIIVAIVSLSELGLLARKNK